MAFIYWLLIVGARVYSIDMEPFFSLPNSVCACACVERPIRINFVKSYSISYDEKSEIRNKNILKRSKNPELELLHVGSAQKYTRN